MYSNFEVKDTKTIYKYYLINNSTKNIVTEESLVELSKEEFYSEILEKSTDIAFEEAVDSYFKELKEKNN